jgi:hypothetical protein
MLHTRHKSVAVAMRYARRGTALHQQPGRAGGHVTLGMASAEGKT